MHRSLRTIGRWCSVFYVLNEVFYISTAFKITQHIAAECSMVRNDCILRMTAFSPSLQRMITFSPCRRDLEYYALLQSTGAGKDAAASDVPARLLPPSAAAVTAAVRAIKTFMTSPECDGRAVAVFSEDGCNRAGVIVVSWLMEERALSLALALDRFRKHRPPGVYSPHCLRFLVERAKTMLHEKNARAPSVAPPAWDQRQIKLRGGGGSGGLVRAAPAPAKPSAGFQQRTLRLALSVAVKGQRALQPVCSLVLSSGGRGAAIFTQLERLARAGVGNGGEIPLVVEGCVDAAASRAARQRRSVFIPFSPRSRLIPPPPAHLSH